MITLNVEVDSAEGITQLMSRFNDSIIQYAPAALESSISVNVRTPSMEIVPISDPNRYAPIKNGRRQWTKGYAPNSSGTLMRSYTQKVQNVTDSSFEVKVGYETPYAFYVHEMDDLRTNWSRPGSHSQFLADPIKNNKDKVISDMVTDVLGRIQL